MNLSERVRAAGRLYLPSAQRRLALGGIQGVTLGALNIAIMHHVAPFSHRTVTTPLVTILTVLPVLLLLDMKRMRWRCLTLLMTVETLIAGTTALQNAWQGSWTGAPRLLEGTIFGLLVFIVQVMAFAADQDRRWRPRYATLFEVAWGQAVLLCLAALFTVFAWSILLLASALFASIAFTWIGHLLVQPMVHPIITWVTFAGAVTVCIDAEDIVRGTQRLILSLFSTLLPVITWLSVTFLAALMTISHTRSWTSHMAGWLLSLTATVMVLLLNALFQDGCQAKPPGRLLRLSGRVAAVVILPLTLLALEPLGVRVVAHGWTVERLLAAALLGILTCYGTGYFVGALRSERWLSTMAFTNITVAALSAVVFLSLLTPIADPRRLASLDQTSRLRNGTIPSAAFPYRSLARDYGEYGRRALQSLIETPPARQGKEVQHNTYAALAGRLPPPAPTLSSRPFDHVTLHPQGATLPDDLKTAALNPDFSLMGCLHDTNAHCDAITLPMSPDGVSRVALVGALESIEILAKAPGQNWHREGQIYLPPQCSRQKAALLLDGKAMVGAVTLPVLILGGARYTLSPPPALKCGN